MRGEDDVERLLRVIDERRQEIIDLIAHGGASADNVSAGYRDLTGQVKGLDLAEQVIREVMRPYLPEQIRVTTPAKPKSGDY